MLSQEWQTSPSGELSFLADDLRLVIRKCGGYTRYLILHRGTQDDGHPEILLGSGTESDLRAAMIAARRAAQRAGFVLAERAMIRVDHTGATEPLGRGGAV